jgi:hypothetical protein
LRHRATRARYLSANNDLLHLQDVAHFVQVVWEAVGGSRRASVEDLVKLAMLLAFAGWLVWTAKTFMLKVIVTLAP